MTECVRMAVCKQCRIYTSDFTATYLHDILLLKNRVMMNVVLSCEVSEHMFEKKCRYGVTSLHALSYLATATSTSNSLGLWYCHLQFLHVWVCSFIVR